MATKVSLPPIEASKASFPPGCRVLCFDKTGFRVGTVRGVQVSISLPTGATFGTFYDVEINGSPKSGVRGKLGGSSLLFTESSLRFTPGCPVEVTAEYFASVFRFAGNEGKVQGTVIGCFEMPLSQHTRPMEETQNFDVKRKYFYSVRVKFKGMDEAVEAHGVPPHHVSIRPDGPALSEITGDYNAEVFDCFSLTQTDSRVRRPEDIPLSYTPSHESGDHEHYFSAPTTGYDSESGSSMQSYAKQARDLRGGIMAKGFAGRYPSAEPSIRRLRDLQVDGSTPSRRNMRRMKAKNRSLTPVARTSLRKSQSRAKVYKVGPGVARPPSNDINIVAAQKDEYGVKSGNSKERRSSDAIEIESRQDIQRGADEYDQNGFGQQDEDTNYLSDDLSSDEMSTKDEMLDRYEEKDLQDDAVRDTSSRKHLRVNTHLQSEPELHRNYEADTRDETSAPHKDINGNIYSDKRAQVWDHYISSQGSEGGFENDENLDHAYDASLHGSVHPRHELDHQKDSTIHHNHLDHDVGSNESIEEEEIVHSSPEQISQNGNNHVAAAEPTHEIEDCLSGGEYDNFHQPVDHQNSDSSHLLDKSHNEVSRVENRETWTNNVSPPENQNIEQSILPKKIAHQVVPVDPQNKWGGESSSKDVEQSNVLPKQLEKDVPLTPKSSAKRVGVISSTKFEPFSFLGNNTPSEETAVQDVKVAPAAKQTRLKQDASVGNTTHQYSINPNTTNVSGGKERQAKLSPVGRIKSRFEPQSEFKSRSQIIPSKPSTEGCYFTYETSNGGTMQIKYSHGPVAGAMGFWCPGPEKSIQGFKFKQNQGRSDIIKNVIGRDIKKKYFSGWCQFVKAARMSGGLLCKWPNKGGIEVDIYVFNKETCGIKHVENGEYCDVSAIDAVACIPAGNETYSGVKRGEYNKFLNLGQGVGASIAIGGM